ncbi:MAG: TraR/DksA family transcriptional regulator [Candidatus Taylorbacteria bacterium]|nr:TraR/DksA family transcriptional regulator [Candidatus Taylorbacteria bacterium]
MNTKDLEYFKNKLEKERGLLEEELKSVGRKDTSNGNGWSATSNDRDIDTADENEVADKMEELEDNEGILNQLEKQYKEVVESLKRIENGTYGICEVSGEPIERERLEANPSARTSMKHMQK